MKQNEKCHFSERGRCTALYSTKCDGIKEGCTFYKTEEQFLNGQKKCEEMQKTKYKYTNIAEVQFAKYKLYNSISGTYICTVGFKHKIFNTYSDAKVYIKDRNLNPNIYKPVRLDGKEIGTNDF